MKKKTTSQLKKELDRVFSIYIRQKYADEKGRVWCYTCNKVMPWKESQCGHFVSRSHTSTRWSDDNCRVQCVGCNVFGGGKLAIFATRLEAEMGVGIVSRLYREAQKIVKDYPYEKQIEHYKKLIKGDKK